MMMALVLGWAAATAAGHAPGARRQLYMRSSSSHSGGGYGGYRYPSSSSASRYNYPSSTPSASSSASVSHAAPPDYHAPVHAAAPAAAAHPAGYVPAASHQPGAAYAPHPAAGGYAHPPVGGAGMSAGSAAAAGALAGGALGYVAGSSHNGVGGGYGGGGYGGGGYGSGYENGGGYAGGNGGGGGMMGGGGVMGGPGLHAHSSVMSTVLSLLLALGCAGGACYAIYAFTQPGRKAQLTLPLYGHGGGAAGSCSGAALPQDGVALGDLPEYVKQPQSPPPVAATFFPAIDLATAARLGKARGLPAQTAVQLLAARAPLSAGTFLLADDSAATAAPMLPAAAAASAAAACAAPATAADGAFSVWDDVRATVGELGGLLLALGPPVLPAGAEEQPLLWLKLLNVEHPAAVDSAAQLGAALDGQEAGGADEPALGASLRPLLAPSEAAQPAGAERLVLLLLGGVPSEPQLPQLREMLAAKAGWVRVVFLVCGDDSRGAAATLAGALSGLPGVSVCGAYALAAAAAASRGIELPLAEHLAHALLPRSPGGYH